MSKTICPGQDTRFWQPGDIFSIQCGNCGTSIEFFKDEANRKCPGCGMRVQNPRLSMGCAQWCEHAVDCLGYDPKKVMKEFEPSSDQDSMASIIIDALAKELGKENETLIKAGHAWEKARTLLHEEKGQPRIVIPAVLLLFADGKESYDVGSLGKTKKILGDVNIDASSTDQILEIIISHHKGDEIDTPEYRIVTRAYAED